MDIRERCESVVALLEHEAGKDEDPKVEKVDVDVRRFQLNVPDNVATYSMIEVDVEHTSDCEGHIFEFKLQTGPNVARDLIEFLTSHPGESDTTDIKPLAELEVSEMDQLTSELFPGSTCRIVQDHTTNILMVDGVEKLRVSYAPSELSRRLFDTCLRELAGRGPTSEALSQTEEVLTLQSTIRWQESAAKEARMNAAAQDREIRNLRARIQQLLRAVVLLDSTPVSVREMVEETIQEFGG